MKLFLVFFTLNMYSVLTFQIYPVQSQEGSRVISGEPAKSISYKYVIIPASGKTWGYDIYKGKQLLIHQPCIPGLPGNEGFKTKGDAEKIARLVIEKIKMGKMPPTVTVEEMKKLNVL